MLFAVVWHQSGAGEQSDADGDRDSHRLQRPAVNESGLLATCRSGRPRVSHCNFSFRLFINMNYYLLLFQTVRHEKVLLAIGESTKITNNHRFYSIVKGLSIDDDQDLKVRIIDPLLT